MADVTIALTRIEGETRIRDIDLGARLGFGRPADIRKLIERHKENLSKISVLATVAQTPETGGRPSTSYYLNRKQAIFITAKSDTDRATDITIEIIEKFDAYERGIVPGARVAWADRSNEDRRVELETISAYRHCCSTAAAWWYAQEHAGLPAPPRALQPAWRQFDMLQVETVSVTTRMASGGGI